MTTRREFLQAAPAALLPFAGNQIKPAEQVLTLPVHQVGQLQIVDFKQTVPFKSYEEIPLLDREKAILYDQYFQISKTTCEIHDDEHKWLLEIQIWHKPKTDTNKVELCLRIWDYNNGDWWWVPVRHEEDGSNKSFIKPTIADIKAYASKMIVMCHMKNSEEELVNKIKKIIGQAATNIKPLHITIS